MMRRLSLLFLAVLLFATETYARVDCSLGPLHLSEDAVQKNWEAADLFLQSCRKQSPYEAAVFANSARLALEKSDYLSGLAAYLRSWELAPYRPALDPQSLKTIIQGLSLSLEDSGLEAGWTFGESWSGKTLSLILSWFSLGQWQCLLTLLLIFSCLALAMLFFGESTRMKIVFTGLTVSSFAFAWLAFLLFRGAPLGYAVIASPQAALSSPSELGTKLFDLKVGTPVAITDTLSVSDQPWVQVSLLDQQRAWVKRENILSYSEF